MPLSLPMSRRKSDHSTLEVLTIVGQLLQRMQSCRSSVKRAREKPFGPLGYFLRLTRLHKSGIMLLKHKTLQTQQEEKQTTRHPSGLFLFYGTYPPLFLLTYPQDLRCQGREARYLHWMRSEAQPMRYDGDDDGSNLVGKV